MLEQVVRNIIPVQSFSKERVVRKEIRVPDVGLRWGQPADFILDVDDTEEKKKPANYISNKPVIVDLVGAEVKREYEVVEITTSEDDTFETETIKNIVFFCNETVDFVWEAKPDTSIPRGSVRQFEEIRVITRTYVRFLFPPNIRLIEKDIRGDPETPDEGTKKNFEFETDLEQLYDG